MENQVVVRESIEVPARFNTKQPRNQEIMLRFLEGQSVEEIANHFDLTTNTIRNVLKSPLVEQEIERLSKLIAENGVTERIKNLSPEAIDTVRDTMRGSNKSELKLKAANSLLDRNPELSAKKDDSEKFAQGLGESIIRAIGKKLYEKQANEPATKEIDISETSNQNNL